MISSLTVVPVMPPPDDERTRALLLLYQGEPLSTVASLIGVTEEDLQNWLRDAGRAAQAQAGMLPSNPTSDMERRAFAQHLLTKGDFVSVEPPEEPGVPPNEDLAVFYDDVAAHDFQELVVESVNIIAAFPGVDAARHYDRELIVVWGNVDAGRLRDRLERWWRDRLGVIASPP